MRPVRLCEFALTRFRTMYWNDGNGVYTAAMDGSQHRNLVNNTQRYINGLAIDAEGQLHHGETSSKYSAMQIYFDDLFYYRTCVMVFWWREGMGETGMERRQSEGKGEVGRQFEVILNVF